VIRLHLTVDDLSRIRFAAAPAPLMEVVMAVAELQRRPSRPMSRGVPDAARPLLDLVPPTAAGPLFMDPITAEFGEGLELVRRSPQPAVRSELTRVWRHSERPPTWLSGLADGDREAWAILERSLRAFFASCLAPRWHDVEREFHLDIANRQSVLVHSGVGALLEGLHPALRWRAGILEQVAPRPLDLALDGQGLLLLPTVSWTGPPLFAVRPPGLGPHALVYGARSTEAPPSRSVLDRRPAHGRLAGLLGNTRAKALWALSRPCGTVELSRRLGISQAAASEHACVRREAGLITTTREGKGVEHALTPLGARLLDPSGRGSGGAATVAQSDLNP
jgi:DNA-binding transcriptional ArsR family regulator